MDSRQLKKVLEAQKNLYLKPGDNILVVITSSFKNAPMEKVLQGYDHEIVRIPDAQHPGENYQLNGSFLDGRTVGWLISNVSISHSVSSRKMIDRGMFLISNPGITSDWPAMLNPVNSQICQKNADNIINAIGGDVGGELHIIADDGTDLKLKVPNGNWEKETGTRKGIGTNGLYGELATSPYEADGTYVLKPGDFLTNPLNRVYEEVRLTIRSNRIVEIRGGVLAKTFKKMLEETNDPKAFNLGEFAIGINPGKPKGVYRSVVAEKMISGIHIAAGTNSICLKESCPDLSKFQYGRYNCGIHIDAIKFNPSVFFKADGKGQCITIMKNGKLMV